MNPLQTESSITVRDLKCRLDAGSPAFLLDVRSPGEYETVHVPEAKLIPLDQLDPVKFSSQQGTEPVYVLCQTGGRAQRAIAKLAAAGVTGCVLVEGGTQAWLDAGFPVVRGESRVLPLMRQVQIVVGFLSVTGSVLALTVNPKFVFIPLFIGCGLLVAGLTGFCGLAVLLAKMPWNQSCKACCKSK